MAPTWSERKERERGKEEERKRRGGEKGRGHVNGVTLYQGEEARIYKIRGTGTELGFHPNDAHFYLLVYYFLFQKYNNSKVCILINTINTLMLNALPGHTDIHRHTQMKLSVMNYAAN